MICGRRVGTPCRKYVHDASEVSKTGDYSGIRSVIQRADGPIGYLPQQPKIHRHPCPASSGQVRGHHRRRKRRKTNSGRTRKNQTLRVRDQTCYRLKPCAVEWVTDVERQMQTW